MAFGPCDGRKQGIAGFRKEKEKIPVLSFTQQVLEPRYRYLVSDNKKLSAELKMNHVYIGEYLTIYDIGFDSSFGIRI